MNAFPSPPVRSLALAVAATFVAVPAHALDKTFSIVALEEEPTADGLSTVNRIDHLQINNTGYWLVELDSDIADTDADTLVIDPEGLKWQEGQSLPEPASATLDSFDSLSLDNANQVSTNWFLDGVGANDSGIFVNGAPLLIEGAVSAAEEFAEGTEYVGFFETKRNDLGQVLALCSVDDPSIPSGVDRALVRLSTTGSLVSEVVLAKEGDSVKGTDQTIDDFETNSQEFAFNNAGSYLAIAEISGSSTADTVVLLDGEVVAREGSPSPVTDRNWGSLSTGGLDLNDSGEWVLRGVLDGDSASNVVLVRDGEVVAAEGEPAPNSTYTLENVGSNVRITNAGDVVWHATWLEAPSMGDSALYFNEEIIVAEGDEILPGAVIESLLGGSESFEVSDNGKYILFEADLAGGLNGAFAVELAVDGGCGADGSPCDDGNVCSIDDACFDGVCFGTPIAPCCPPTGACGSVCLAEPDINGSGGPDIVDVQCAILVTLWEISGGSGPAPSCAEGNPAAVNQNCDAETNVTDITILITLVLGGDLPLVIDSNQDSCPDSCEVLPP